jgi:hypothetical protein
MLGPQNGLSKMRFLAAAIWLICVAPTCALAQQQPALSSSWAETTVSQDACLERAEQAMRQLGWLRIERLTNIGSVFADSKDKLYQIFIRCVAHKQVVFIAAAGPNEAESTSLAMQARTTFEKLGAN